MAIRHGADETKAHKIPKLLLDMPLCIITNNNPAANQDIDDLKERWGTHFSISLKNHILLSFGIRTRRSHSLPLLSLKQIPVSSTVTPRSCLKGMSHSALSLVHLGPEAMSVDTWNPYRPVTHQIERTCPVVNMIALSRPGNSDVRSQGPWRGDVCDTYLDERRRIRRGSARRRDP